MLEAAIGLIGLLTAVVTWWLSRTTSSDKVKSDINAEKVRRMEEIEAAESKSREDEFNAKADAVHDAAAAAELLREASRRSTRPR